MYRDEKFLQNEELYSRCGDIINNSVLAIGKQIFSLRDYLAGRKKEISDAIRKSSDKDKNGKGDAGLEVARNFYDHAIKELVEIEGVCQKFFTDMKKDLSSETKDRLLPPSDVPYAKAKEAFELCKDLWQEPEEVTKRASRECRCLWKNVDKSVLEDTQDIALRPKTPIPSAFDESDIKFKQEMTILRAKMFASDKKEVKRFSGIDKEITKDPRAESGISSTKDFIEVEKRESFRIPSATDEVAKVHALKFVDGEFNDCEIWSKALDIHGEQYFTKWYFAMCPQIGKIMKKRSIPVLHFAPAAVFDFLPTIYENGIMFVLEKEMLLPLLVDPAAEGIWLKSWKKQFRTIEGKDIAATLIQSLWRGYWLRKKIRETQILYIAASVIWCWWISLKKKEQMQKRYLNRMLTSLNETRELSLKLSKDFPELIQEPHVVIHLPSLSYPWELRRIFSPKIFAMHQNTTCLRISSLRNPRCTVIYVLPIQSSEDLLQMYRDTIESVTDSSTASRAIFLGLSELETFANRSMNMSRILHCSVESLKVLEKVIEGKPAYFLPWIVDECDMRLAGMLEIPLLAPDWDLQQKYLHVSKVAKMIDALRLPQPVHSGNLQDYPSLCDELAQLIVVNTEICSWLIRLNRGMKSKHHGIFLINHISVPFMPLLRREREKHGDEWKVNADLRAVYLERLRQQLPKVVSALTRLSGFYQHWAEFYGNLQKFGCILQAVPDEKNGRLVAVTLFVAGKQNREKPKWTCTADKIHLESSFSTYAYMIPQTSLENVDLEKVVDKFAKALENDGYFGYLTVDCYCYFREREEKMAVLITDVHPYYSHAQQYSDWLKFVIGGSYKRTANVVTINDFSSMGNDKRKSFTLPSETPKWNQTAERFAIAISELHHANLKSFAWPQLKEIIERSGIVYDKTTKEGSHLLLLDGQVKNVAMMVVISSSITTALTVAQTNLRKLHRCLRNESKKRVDSNLKDVAHFFAKLSLNFQNMSQMNKCD